MRCSWLCILLLVVGAEAVQVTTVATQMREARLRMRERQKAVLGNADLGKLATDMVSHVFEHKSFKKGLGAFATKVLRQPDAYGLDLEVVVDPAHVKELYHALENDTEGMTREEWVAQGFDPDVFDKVDLDKKGTISPEELRRYSNSVGKVGSSTSLLEYPYLVQQLCASPSWLRVCVAVGPYTVVQGLTMLLTLFIGGFAVVSTQMLNTVADKRANDESPTTEWFERYEPNEEAASKEEGRVDTLLAWKPYIGVILLSVGYLLLEILHIVRMLRQPAYAVTEHRRAWFNHLRRLRKENANVPDNSLALGGGDPVRDAQLKALADAAGVTNLAASRREREDAESVNIPVNDVTSRSSRVVGYVIGGLLWAVLCLVFIGLFSKGVFNNATYAGRPWLLAIPLVMFVGVAGLSLMCDKNRGQRFCRAFSRDSKAVALGLLALMSMILPIVRDVEHTKEPLKLDPINALNLTANFDYDPRATSDVQGRTLGLLFGWLVTLVVGMIWSGGGKGSSVVAYMVSDSARLFTNSLALVQDVYMFWHGYTRFSNYQGTSQVLMHKELPGWASAFVTDLVTFVGDVMAIYPILYDYLSWKHASRVDFLRQIDLVIVVIICVGALYKVHSVNGRSNDTAERGQTFNQGAFAFSCFVLMVQLLLYMVRDGAGIKTALYGVFMFAICVFLYLLMSMNMAGDRPLVDGHLVSDLYMMKSMTGAMVFLQNMVKMAEPRWVYPNGEASKGLLVINFLSGILGRGYAKPHGNAKIGESLSRSKFALDGHGQPAEQVDNNEDPNDKLSKWLARGYRDLQTSPDFVDQALRQKDAEVNGASNQSKLSY